MVGSKASSTRTTHKSSCDSTFSRATRHTNQTDITTYSRQDSIKQSTSSTSHKQNHRHRATSFEDEGYARSSSSSVDTYASTEASDDDLPATQPSFPKQRRRCFDPDAVPSTPADFAELFPTSRRIMIQHDDSSPDGNMNLRVDTDVTTKSGRKRKMTLFHLKMKDLQERQFSLRRYWRSSGREVASCKRQYVKPLPAGVKSSKSSLCQSPTAAAFKRPIPHRQDSGYHSEDEDDDDFAESLQALSFAQGLKATIPTDSIRLEFSNYAQVIVEPQVQGHKKQYNFEYWGDYYTWRRRSLRDGHELITSYELVNLKTSKKVASIVPDALSAEEKEFEASQGAWIPACSMRIMQKDVSDDLGDVIVATGLIALTDDCIPQ